MAVLIIRINVSTQHCGHVIPTGWLKAKTICSRRLSHLTLDWIVSIGVQRRSSDTDCFFSPLHPQTSAKPRNDSLKDSIGVHYVGFHSLLSRHSFLISIWLKLRRQSIKFPFNEVIKKGKGSVNIYSFCSLGGNEVQYPCSCCRKAVT